MAKLRLVKVLVQPVFVLDDGDTLKPVQYPGTDGQPSEQHAVIEVPGDEWAAYSGERFPAEVKAWQELIDADTPKPNRTQRRAKKPPTAER